MQINHQLSFETNSFSYFNFHMGGHIEFLVQTVS